MSDKKDRSKINGDLVTIDFTVWCTQAQYAALTGEPLCKISTNVKRSLAGTAGPKTLVDTLQIPHLPITLVKRPD